MKVIIAGGRNYIFQNKDFEILDYIATKWSISEVVSGGATGADQGGEDWAIKNNISIKKFPADWSKYGKVAGPIRNAEMAAYADGLILFPGGRGSKNMLETAKEFNLEILTIKDDKVYYHKYKKCDENEQ